MDARNNHSIIIHCDFYFLTYIAIFTVSMSNNTQIYSFSNSFHFYPVYFVNSDSGVEYYFHFVPFCSVTMYVRIIHGSIFGPDVNVTVYIFHLHSNSYLSSCVVVFSRSIAKLNLFHHVYHMVRRVHILNILSLFKTSENLYTANHISLCISDELPQYVRSSVCF